MRRKRRKVTWQSTPETHGWIHWLWVLLGLSALGWVWWQTRQWTDVELKPGAQARTRVTRPATNAPAAPVPVAPPVEVSVTHETKAVHPKSAPPETVSPPSGIPVQDILEAQIALARLGISTGSIDGRIGPQTRQALRQFQQQSGLAVTGKLDPPTCAQLTLAAPPWTTYSVRVEDLSRLRPLSATWLGKSQQDRLDYETILELVAEKSHSHPEFIRSLNPGIAWTNVLPGTAIKIPAVEYPLPNTKATLLRIHLKDRILQAFDAQTNLLAQFPCSIAQRVDKRPVGELRVVTVIPNPDYLFNPEIFPESAEARRLQRKLHIPSGPNNPVGVAWIGLSKSGYGIHGTPRPEDVGRTESHGCFRLSNWNAEYLAKLVSPGTKVTVEP